MFEKFFWNAIDLENASTIRVGDSDGTGFFVEDDGSGIPSVVTDEVFESGSSIF